MMRKSGRSDRRHHRERLKNVRKRYYSWGELENSPRQVGIYVNSAKVCSCYMCGNPRKWFGELSMQEKRHIDKCDEREENNDSEDC